MCDKSSIHLFSIGLCAFCRGSCETSGRKTDHTFFAKQKNQTDNRDKSQYDDKEKINTPTVLVAFLG